MRLEIDPDVFEPIIAQTVEAVLDRIGEQNAKLGTRIAYSEGEAAALLGVARHVLRDERLRGRIQARRVGKSYRYSREELRRYLKG